MAAKFIVRHKINFFTDHLTIVKSAELKTGLISAVFDDGLKSKKSTFVLKSHTTLLRQQRNAIPLDRQIKSPSVSMSAKQG
jgi:hypothetical protein